ncbi:MAG: 4-hydroxythreonine-4-phosphate dehydrogenase PdxA [Flavobacteriales bacterium]|jgi:4-hydroxythreonine-4-phosphate dehydrogenase|nr:4-hydroxythreonine-4-phosphate dehydrogenase PdxA [Flavobacteriales bacterium]
MGKHKKIRVAISCGDINGIGLEVALKTLSDSRVYEHCVPVIYASAKTVNFHMKTIGVEGFSFKECKTADEIDANKINVVNTWSDDAFVNFGQLTEDGGKYAFKSLQAAVEDIASNKMDVLITAPINKENIQSADFNFPGHTEYLANYANEDNPLMILAHDQLRVALVSGHMALKDVSSSLSADRIVTKAQVFARSLTQDFGINRPKIAILGLNPHNGDGGLMGEEEKEIIRPAIAQLTQEGILAFGPFPADGFFGSSQRSNFDGVLAMYHDQGLAPFKALSFDGGVNFTAGLPIVRTSPDHGTAFDIAGKGEADPTSFRNAIFLAMDIYNTRKSQRALESSALQTSSDKAL